MSTPAVLTRTGRQATLDFRVLLDCLANPGRIGTLDLPDQMPPAVLPVASLADVEVALSVLESRGSRWGERLRLATGARLVEPADAQLCLVLKPATAADVSVLPAGDPYQPEDGCRLILTVTALAEAADTPAGAVIVTTRGPGVPGERSFAVTGLAPEVLDALTAANASFPAGVDTFLVDLSGRVVGLPRSNRLRWSTEGNI